MKKILFAILATLSSLASAETAIFAGGCFWCIQHEFDHTDGVISTAAGYTAGQTSNPTYKDVKTGKTGHVEAVQVVYDPTLVSYSQLLEIYWSHVEPTRNDGQFYDRGSQYKPVIFYLDEAQHQYAEDSKTAIQAQYPLPILVEIWPAAEFFPAEDYHQHFYDKHPQRNRGL